MKNNSIPKDELKKFMAWVSARNTGEQEFLQAVHEVAEKIIPYIEDHPRYQYGKVLERLVEPERSIIFRVPWLDDQGEVQINRGYRVQFNSAIGPYKGGLRFHPSVNLSIMKFLGFEQVFKNALTSLPMGGAKGGSDFNPKGKSDNEIMKFCQSFMSELYRHIGPNLDVPAGDIGVGGREIGFLFGQYKRIRNEFTGVLTGKGLEWGGSVMRPQATGFGLIYFVQEMMQAHGLNLSGKTVAVSGFGQVAWGAITKANQLGAKVISISGPDGYILDESGISGSKIDFLLELRASNNDIVAPYAQEFGAKFVAGKRPWELKAEIALPCATQNELDTDDAQNLINNGVLCVAEGANMPCSPEAITLLQANNILFSPGKASNAGGVATSGLEMTQNSMRINWLEQEVDDRLHKIMQEIHRQCQRYGQSSDGSIDYVKGANIAGFVKVADAMLAQGLV